MPKFFINNNQIQDDIIIIVGQDVNHIKNVLRLNINDEITVCNKETGDNYLAKILERKQEEILCKTLKKIEKIKQNIEVTIFQGLPKADKMELIIQKCSELGVKEITPVQMERCIVRLDGKSKSKKFERWQKIAEAAAKQCKSDNICTINSLSNIKNVCNQIQNYDIVLVPYEKEKNNSFKNQLKKIEEENIKIAIVIGPEGGFHEKEIEELKNCGAKTITLGKRILRTETVSIAMISSIMYEFGELG